MSAEVNPLITNFPKRSNTLKQFVGKLSTICLSVFDQFMGFALGVTKRNRYNNVISCDKSSVSVCVSGGQKFFFVSKNLACFVFLKHLF